MLVLKYLKPFERGDAAAISSLFKLVYGDNYIYSEVYDPQNFCKNHENGSWQSILAIDSSEKVIGHGLLWSHSTSPDIPELSLIVVHPEARNLGLAFKISQELIVIAKLNNADGVSAKQICSHPFSQRIGQSLGFLNLSFWPEYTPSLFDETASRESLVEAYLPLKIKPIKKLFITEVLIPNAKLLVAELKEVETVQSSSLTPTQLELDLVFIKSEVDVFELYLHRWGENGIGKLELLDPSKLTFILVNAELPENTMASKILLNLGFYFMGLVPDRFRCWTWLFVKNFNLDRSIYILDEKINKLLEIGEENIICT